MFWKAEHFIYMSIILTGKGICFIIVFRLYLDFLGGRIYKNILKENGCVICVFDVIFFFRIIF